MVSRKRWAVIAVLILFVCVAYFNSLQNDFVSDDIYAISNNKEIDKITHVSSQPFFFLRPLFYFSITKIFGKLPIFYRLINLSLHLGAVLIIYFLLSRLIDAKTAFFAASIFAVHPIEIEAVSWISGGPYSQYSFFFILAFFFYVLSAQNRKFYPASIISFTFSIISGEKAMVFPLALLVFAISFQDITKTWKKLVPFFMIGAIWGMVSVLRIGERLNALQTTYSFKPQTLNPLIQIPIAITSYLELIFWPKDLTLYHSEMSFSQGEYFLRLMIFIIFLGAIVYFYKRNRQVFFWLSFFLVTLLPTLTPLGISWIVAERYVYLGSLGIFAVIAIVFKKLSQAKRMRPAINIFFCLIVISLLIRTIIRNIDWKNEDNLWIATGRTSPSSPNTHNNLGDVYSRRGDLEKAALEFKKAIEINPRYADAYHNLANTYLVMGRFEEAINNYQKAIYLKPGLWQSYQDLGVVYFNLRKYDMAKENLLQAVKINPQDSHLHANLGIIFVRLQERKKAIEELQMALQLDSNNRIAKEALLSLNPD